jgi:hypothetical protein
MQVTVDQVQQLARQLSPVDQLRLVEGLAHDLRQQHNSDYADFPASASAQAAAEILPQEDFTDWESK